MYICDLIYMSFIITQWVGSKQKEFQVNSMQLLYYQVRTLPRICHVGRLLISVLSVQ